MARVNDTFLLIGRLLIASLFLTVGIPKVLQGYGGAFAQGLARMGLPYPEILGVVAVAIEVLVPIALILGIWPRISALVLIAFVLIATALSHRFWEYPPAAYQGQLFNFLKNVAIIGGLFFYYVSGPGAFALSGRRVASGSGIPARA
jgi:putative oxidoreductase